MVNWGIRSRAEKWRCERSLKTSSQHSAVSIQPSTPKPLNSTPNWDDPLPIHAKTARERGPVGMTWVKSFRILVEPRGEGVPLRSGDLVIGRQEGLGRIYADGRGSEHGVEGSIPGVESYKPFRILVDGRGEGPPSGLRGKAGNARDR